MQSCPICQKHDELQTEPVLYMDEQWVIRHGSPQSDILGYFYLEPRRHVEYWSELSEEELVNIGALIKKMETALRKELPLERLYVVTISEAVRHLHFHLIPRFKDNETRGIGLISQATAPTFKDKSLDSDRVLAFIDNMKIHFKN